MLLLSSVGSAIKLQDIKTEPPSIFLGQPFGSMSNDSRQGLVSVAITLRPAAAEVGRLLCFKIKYPVSVLHRHFFRQQCHV